MLKLIAFVGAAIAGLFSVWLLTGGVRSFGIMSFGFGCSIGGLFFAGLIVTAIAFLMFETEPAV